MIILNKDAGAFAPYLSVMEAAVAGARAQGWNTAEPSGQSLELGSIALSPSVGPHAGKKPSGDFKPEL